MRFLAEAQDKNLKLIDEIRDAFVPEARRAGKKGLGLKVPTPERGEREPTDSHVANWVLARFFAMPRADRERFIREGKAIVDEHLASDEAFPFRADRPFRADDVPAAEAGVPETADGKGPNPLVRPGDKTRGTRSA